MPVPMCEFVKVFDRLYRQLAVQAAWEPYAATSARRIAWTAVQSSNCSDWPSVMTTLMRRNSADNRLDPDAPFKDRGVAVRICTRMALAVVTQDRNLLRLGEEEIIKNAFGARRWRSAGANIMPAPEILAEPGAIVQFETALVSARPARRGSPKGYLKGSANIAIPVIAPISAVAYRLRTPNGAWIDILDIEGQRYKRYRPLIAPNSWTPISLSDFVSAMRSGVAWRDHPGYDCPVAHHATGFVLHMDDVADQTIPQSRAEAALQGERARQVEEGCAGLIVIDGKVCRPTPEPQAQLILRAANGRYRNQFHEDVECLLTWECGSLRSWIDPAPYMRSNAGSLIGGVPEICTLPIAFEPILRAVANAINKREEQRVATRGDEKMLFPSSLSELAEIAGPIRSLAPYITSVECELEDARAAIATFEKACREEEHDEAKSSARLLRKAILELAASSGEIEVRGERIGHACRDYRFEACVRVAVAALTLANEAELAIGRIESNFTEAAFDLEAAQAIEDAFLSDVAETPSASPRSILGSSALEVSASPGARKC